MPCTPSSGAILLEMKLATSCIVLPTTCTGQVVGAGNQVHRAHFGEAGDTLGDGVEADVALRADPHLDEGR